MAALLQFCPDRYAQQQLPKLALHIVPDFPAAKQSALVSDRKFGVCMSFVVYDIDWCLLKRMDAMHRVILQPSNVATACMPTAMFVDPSARLERPHLCPSGEAALSSMHLKEGFVITCPHHSSTKLPHNRKQSKAKKAQVKKTRVCPDAHAKSNVVWSTKQEPSYIPSISGALSCLAPALWLSPSRPQPPASASSPRRCQTSANHSAFVWLQQHCCAHIPWSSVAVWNSKCHSPTADLACHD